MAIVSYEILTTVRKTFYIKALRAYVFTGQIIIKGMAAHNFAQLDIPVNGTIAVFPVKEHISAKTELTNTALKTAITKRMDAIKKRFEKKLQPKKEAVKLTASGNYKTKLSTMAELSK